MSLWVPCVRRSFLGGSCSSRLSWPISFPPHLPRLAMFWVLRRLLPDGGMLSGGIVVVLSSCPVPVVVRSAGVLLLRMRVCGLRNPGSVAVAHCLYPIPLVVFKWVSGTGFFRGSSDGWVDSCLGKVRCISALWPFPPLEVLLIVVCVMGRFPF